MPVKRRAVKPHIPQPVASWDDLTDVERAWVLGDPLPHEPYGEQWGISDAPDKIDLWRPGRPSATELLEMFGDLALKG
jgi:hypothetical protein